MKVIIPVAGKGTRMRPFTHSKPKPLLPVAGKPVIDHLLDRILPLHPTEIVFVTGHLKAAFEHYIREKYPHVRTSFVEQATPRGPGDAIWMAKAAFDEPLLIVYSDSIFDADLTAIARCADDGIIWAAEVDDPRRFGVIVNDADGCMTRIVEKPQEFVSNLANIGVYYIKNTPLFSQGLQHLYATVPQGKEIFTTGAFQYMIDHGARLRTAPVLGWFDTGTTEETLVTNRALLQKYPGHAPRLPGVTTIPPVAIDPTAVIERSTIGPHVSISAHCTIRGSTLAGCIIDEHTTIIDSTLRDSIIGEHALVQGKSGRLLLGDHSHASRE